MMLGELPIDNIWVKINFTMLMPHYLWFIQKNYL